MLESDDASCHCPRCGAELNVESREQSQPIEQVPSEPVPIEPAATDAVDTDPITPEFVWIPKADPASGGPISQPHFAPVQTEPRKAVSPTSQSKLAMLLVIIGSYASLLTIYVIYQAVFGRANQLESLPDLPNAQQLGGRMLVPRPENHLPPGHELRLGQSQRYGDIRVTPLRVTRGPVQFSHYTANASLHRTPSDPVLKLWLKFENVSPHRSIVPLDPALMYFYRETETVIAFNVIFPAAEQKSRSGRRFYHFDRLAVESEWKIVGQQTNRELTPSEAYETFIPSQEGIEGLSGEIVWRVHFRKGYGPLTGNGVTTLIDVRFRSDEIQEDEA